jgi:hypothetical protein
MNPNLPFEELLKNCCSLQIQISVGASFPKARKKVCHKNDDLDIQYTREKRRKSFGMKGVEHRSLRSAAAAFSIDHHPPTNFTTSSGNF